MTIIRAPRIQRDFTILSNSVCLDSRLTMRALGVLVRLLCRPDNWRTNSAGLAAEFGCGRDAIRGALQELQEAGYLRMDKARDEFGRWSSAWLVFDEPQGVPQEVHQSGKPDAGFSDAGFSNAGKPGPITRTDEPRTDEPRTDEQKKARKPAANPVPEDVPPQVWADWLELRRAKKAPVTETVIASARSEAAKANVTLTAFLIEWCARGSQGLKAAWLADRSGAHQGPAKVGRHAGFDQIDYTKGVNRDGTF